MRVKEALQFAGEYLAAHQLRSPREDAEVLLCSILQCERAFLYAYPEGPLSADQERLFRQWLIKRGEHYPLQYLRGTQEFYGREFSVREGVFIPRPETELLLEITLGILRLRREEELEVVDVGTGSGCVAITLACEEPRARVAAIDKSPVALQTARNNAKSHQCQDRVHFYQGEVLRPIEGHHRRYHLVVSNPPYVSSLARESVDLSVSRYEPDEAVFSGKSGHGVYLELFRQAGGVLRPEGKLVVELGWGEADKVSDLAQERGWGLEGIRKDLAGTDRCAIFGLR